MENGTATKRVLIVDDERAIANALVAKFTAAGFEAKALYSGEDVLAELGAAHYDIMLLDLLMPVTDGWQVLKSIQGQGVKVIITSNLSQDEDIKRAKDMGAMDFMVKSDVSLSDIVKRVTELLGVPVASTG